MDKVDIRLLVFFEDPFWIGICEKISEGRLVVSRIVFGAEPKDYELEEYILEHWYQLRFSPATDADLRERAIKNPKRRQRSVKKQINQAGLGTKSQQALKLLQEANKMERKDRYKKYKQEEKERLYTIKQKKRKERHRGR